MLILAGAVVILIGLLVMAVSRFNIPLGRLPGDIVWRGKNSVFYFPWVSCLLLSILGTLIAWLLRRR